MVRGVGIDIVRISRFGDSKPAFLEKVYTEAERAYLKRKNMSLQTMAGIFAAKEAVLKALGLGIGKAGLRDVEILWHELGAPRVVLYNEVQKHAGGGAVHVSITHDGDMAAAAAVWEGDENA